MTGNNNKEIIPIIKLGLLLPFRDQSRPLKTIRAPHGPTEINTIEEWNTRKIL